MNIKYIFFLLIIFGFTACDDDDSPEIIKPVVLVAGDTDFSTYVAVGASISSGFTDGALFIAGQNNSYPNLLSQKMVLVGGGAFVQPNTNDNIGGLLLGGNIIQKPRLYFDGAGPVVLPGTPTNEITQVLSGPFNNMGVPGAKSFHIIASGYGNLAGVPVGLANPYFARFASSAGTSMLADAVAQAPTFFTLWSGGNDVLSYALAGGDGVDQKDNPDPTSYGSTDITHPGVFAQVLDVTATTLTSGGAKGVIANIPYVTSLPHFTTVPYNAVPLDAATATQLNAGFALYNGGIQQALAALAGTGLFTADEAAIRNITYAAGQNPILILDETLTDLGAINPAFAALPKLRQATADDLFVLPSSSLIGTTVGGNAQLINGITVPLADKWVLIPSEQTAIKTATDAFNATIKSIADAKGLAFVDVNELMQQIASTGFTSGDFILTSALVRGGAFSLDGVHPTARGNALIANQFLMAIDETYGSNFEAAGTLFNIGDYPTNYHPTLQ